jgi:hypothetical protein
MPSGFPLTSRITHHASRNPALPPPPAARKHSAMPFVRQHKFVLSFLLLLVFCSVMVVWQLDARKSLEQSRHVELREAMILLSTGGYTNQADKLYLRLLRDVNELSNKALLEDWHRTVILIDPSSHLPSNVVWRYYWGVRNEMERRSESSIQQALKLAEEN